MQAMFDVADWDKADANNDTKLEFSEFKVFNKASKWQQGSDLIEFRQPWRK